ncbi:hypothetical protein DFO73_12528 [Cytobacillus oceanisediminis]|uniref:Uncharacterized protein n=1 Tax=Cytobacillus oceanisediminis TaxID=665099 RepID=A0A2V2ZH96_9BACI|nr:hypothetical protein [Cytobacillus oceanisediminis]PWW17530.1 hypothetical protein DFO73_12528 [Cytobacillus oceanisediminis]
MIRMSVAGIGGFFLIFVQAYIVMFLKGFQTIDFGGISPFVTIWAMNFFFLFTILTHLKLWHDDRQPAREETCSEKDF